MKTTSVSVAIVVILMALPALPAPLGKEVCECVSEFMSAVEDITKYDEDPISRRRSYEGALERLEFGLQDPGLSLEPSEINRIVGLGASYKDWASIYATLSRNGRDIAQAFEHMAIAAKRLRAICPTSN
jgi:hypothetical protein